MSITSDRPWCTRVNIFRNACVHMCALCNMRAQCTPLRMQCIAQVYLRARSKSFPPLYILCFAVVHCRTATEAAHRRRGHWPTAGTAPSERLPFSSARTCCGISELLIGQAHSCVGLTSSNVGGFERNSAALLPGTYNVIKEEGRVGCT
jgi:hypothetical protein